MLLTQQDQKIDKVSGTIGVLHKMGQDIGIELDEQNKLVYLLLKTCIFNVFLELLMILMMIYKELIPDLWL